MLEHWPLIEADFQREYRIDLMPWLFTQPFPSWRRFLALLSGLGPRSRFGTAVSDPALGQRTQPKARLVTDPKEAERLFKQWAK